MIKYLVEENNIIITDSVIKIGEGAFYDYSSLISINIPNYVIYICNSAFREFKKRMPLFGLKIKRY